MSVPTLQYISREELEALYNEQGMTTGEIGELFGVSAELVRLQMIQMGIPRRNKAEAAKGQRPSARHLRLDRSELELNILRQIHFMLTTTLGIMCPPPHLATHKGYRNSDGYCRNKDCWGLTVKRKESLIRLCNLLESHLKHNKRRQDMESVRQSVIERGIKNDE